MEISIDDISIKEYFYKRISEGLLVSGKLMPSQILSAIYYYFG